jgi:hypothetical protein
MNQENVKCTFRRLQNRRKGGKSPVADKSRDGAVTAVGFKIMTSDDRFCAFRVGHDALLLFTEGESKKPVQLEGGIIPPHET